MSTPRSSPLHLDGPSILLKVNNNKDKFYHHLEKKSVEPSKGRELNEYILFFFFCGTEVLGEIEDGGPL